MNYLRLGDVVSEEVEKGPSKHLSCPRADINSVVGIMRLSMNLAAQVGKMQKTLRDLERVIAAGSVIASEHDAVCAHQLALTRDCVEVAGWLVRIIEEVSNDQNHNATFFGALDALATRWRKRHEGLGAWRLTPFFNLMNAFNPEVSE